MPRHPCMSQLEENWAKMRKFIKEELKIKMSIRTSPGDAGPSGTECHICFRKLSSKPALVKHLAKHDLEPKKEATVKGPPKTGTLLEYEVCFVCLLCGRAFSNVDQCEDHLWNSDSHQEVKAEAAGE